MPNFKVFSETNVFFGIFPNTGVYRLTKILVLPCRHLWSNSEASRSLKVGFTSFLTAGRKMMVFWVSVLLSLFFCFAVLNIKFLQNSEHNPCNGLESVDIRWKYVAHTALFVSSKLFELFSCQVVSLNLGDWIQRHLPELLIASPSSSTAPCNLFLKFRNLVLILIVFVEIT